MLSQITASSFQSISGFCKQEYGQNAIQCDYNLESQDGVPESQQLWDLGLHLTSFSSTKHKQNTFWYYIFFINLLNFPSAWTLDSIILILLSYKKISHLIKKKGTKQEPNEKTVNSNLGSATYLLCDLRQVWKKIFFNQTGLKIPPFRYLP